MVDIIDLNGTIKTEPCKGTYRKTTPKSETASQQLGDSSPAITGEFYISKPAIAADVAHVLQELADPSKSEDDANTRGISADRGFK